VLLIFAKKSRMRALAQPHDVTHYRAFGRNRERKSLVISTTKCVWWSMSISMSTPRLWGVEDKRGFNFMLIQMIWNWWDAIGLCACVGMKLPSLDLGRCGFRRMPCPHSPVFPWNSTLARGTSSPQGACQPLDQPQLELHDHSLNLD